MPLTGRGSTARSGQLAGQDQAAVVKEANIGSVTESRDITLDNGDWGPRADPKLNPDYEPSDGTQGPNRGGQRSGAARQRNRSQFKTIQPPNDRYRRSQADRQPGVGGSRQNASRLSNGTRIFNYNEDDAMNQAYVERVLAQGHSSGQQASGSLAQGSGAEPGDRSGRQRSLNASGHSPGSQLRHQSIDFLSNVKEVPRAGSRGQFATIGDQFHPRASLDQSQLSGFSYLNQSPLIEEVRNNNYGRVRKAMGVFIAGRENSSTVTGAASQQRRRFLRNSFQPGQEQRLRSHQRSSTKFTSAFDSEHPGAVGPKTKISVPKQLVLYQISKNMDAMLYENNFTSNSQQAQLTATGQSSLGAHGVPAQR